MAQTCNSLATSPFACLMSSPVCAVAELILKHSTSTTAANLPHFPLQPSHCWTRTQLFRARGRGCWWRLSSAAKQRFVTLAWEQSGAHPKISFLVRVRRLLIVVRAHPLFVSRVSAVQSQRVEPAVSKFGRRSP